MSKKRNSKSSRITAEEIADLREKTFLRPTEVARVMEIGDNKLYKMLKSPDCPFPVWRTGRLILIPAAPFWRFADGC